MSLINLQPTLAKVLSIKYNKTDETYTSYHIIAEIEKGESLLLFFKDDITTEQVIPALNNNYSYTIQYGIIEYRNDDYVICKAKDGTLFKAYGEITKADKTFNYMMKVTYNYVKYTCIIYKNDNMDLELANKSICWDNDGYVYLKNNDILYKLSSNYVLKEDKISIQASKFNFNGIDPYAPQFIAAREIRDKIT